MVAVEVNEHDGIGYACVLSGIRYFLSAVVDPVEYEKLAMPNLNPGSSIDFASNLNVSMYFH